jgi:tRNA threonylcarbamoyladenosine biosynthesis protein TsaE
MKEIEIAGLSKLPEAAVKFLEESRPVKKFAFHGSMGSGKTTFIKEVCRQLGATDVVTSPTFSLVNEYSTTTGETLYHFDLYRINSIEELFDLGYEDYFFSDSYIFVEWAEKAESLMPEIFMQVFVEEELNGTRRIRLGV